MVLLTNVEIFFLAIISQRSLYCKKNYVIKHEQFSINIFVKIKWLQFFAELNSTPCSESYAIS